MSGALPWLRRIAGDRCGKKALAASLHTLQALLAAGLGALHSLNMIIACPACATRYVVPDSAIGAQGRTVRCAKCRHSWFQDGPGIAAPLPEEAPEAPAPQPVPPRPQPTPAPPQSEPEPEPEPESAPEPEPQAEDAPEIGPEAGAEPAPDAWPGFDERILPQEIIPPPSAFSSPAYSGPPSSGPPSSGPEPEPVRQPVALHDDPVAVEIDEPAEPPQSLVEAPPAETGQVYEDVEYEYSQFEFEPPFQTRRNLLRLWTIAAAVFALFAIGTVVAVSYWGLPQWVPVERPEFGPEQPDLSFDFPPAMQDRRQLPSGTEYFVANGTITNNGGETRRVPVLLVKLRDASNNVVFESEIVPPKRTLSPGETVTVQAGMPDIPRTARAAEFGWKPD